MRLTKVLSTAATAVKAFVIKFAAGVRWGAAFIGRTVIDYQSLAGDGRGNAIVVAVIGWMCRTFPEAPIRVSIKDKDGQFQPNDEHPFINLLDRPNKFYSGRLLWMATIADRAFTGNAYWLKARNSLGRPVELWWVPSTMIDPKWPEDGSEFISHYEYTPNGQPLRIETADVVHFRYGLDPENMRKGLSPLASLAREIFTDDEAANFSATLLRNVGVPGVIVAPDENVNVSQADADRIKSEFEQKFGGDNRGRAMVMSAKTKVTVVSFNPQQMDLKNMRRLPEERVSAVLGIPAIVAGLGAGLDRSTFSNMAEAREAAYESNIIPTQNLIADDLRIQLLPDFGDASRSKIRLDFDNSEVRVLQEDQNQRHTRVRENFRAGMLTRNQALNELGYDPDPYGDVLFVPISLVPTLPADLIPDPIEEQEDDDDGTVPVQLRALPGGFGIKADEASAVINSIQRLRRRLLKSTERAVGSYLTQQAKQVVSRMGGDKKAAEALDADDLVPDGDSDDLRKVLEPVYLRSLDGVHQTVEDVLSASFVLDDPTSREYLAKCGDLIVKITETTRQAVRDALTAGQAEGENLDQLAKRIRGLPEFNRKRARLVARTELGSSTNQAALFTFKASGLVVGVRVFDGDKDEACAAVNGRTFTLADAPASLAHPQCTRAFGPLTDASQLEVAA